MMIYNEHNNDKDDDFNDCAHYLVKDFKEYFYQNDIIVDSTIYSNSNMDYFLGKIGYALEVYIVVDCVKSNNYFKSYK